MSLSRTGCQTCKIRRIKCDEAKPICHRCMKSRRVCLDSKTTKDASFTIHVENQYASGKAKRPRGPRSSLTVRGPQLDLQGQALAYYVQYHVQGIKGAPNLSGGLSDCLTAWRVSGRKCPMVDLALSSLALAVYSKTHQQPPAAKEASMTYYHLLQVARERIAKLAVPALNEQDVDSCLLAVSLMGRYEDAMHITSNEPLPSLPSWYHYTGAMAILKVWAENPARGPATFIIKRTRRALLRYSLARNILLPNWMLDGSKFGEQDLELDYDRITVRVINLRHEFASLPQNNPLPFSIAERLNNEAQELINALDALDSHIPTTCIPKQHILKDLDTWPIEHFYTPIVYSYRKPENSAAWSHLFAIRILINSTRLKILDQCCPKMFPEFAHEQQRLDCVGQLESMADHLASSLPFCLERFKVDDPQDFKSESSLTINNKDDIQPSLATLMVWPLTIAACLEDFPLDKRRQQWFKSELISLGRITGDGILEKMGKDPWGIY